MPATENRCPAKRFPRTARLLQGAEFKRMLQRRPAAAGTHLQIYALSNGTHRARLGLIVARRDMPRAVDRNRIRRILRETFRHRYEQLGGQDLLVRLRRRIDRPTMRALHGEFASLLDALPEHRHRAPL